MQLVARPSEWHNLSLIVRREITNLYRCWADARRVCSLLSLRCNNCCISEPLNIVIDAV